MKKVRTRFAPSPTGYMHIGNLRTALYGYLFAKKEGGEFILRLEDTDSTRIVDGAVQIIYDTLQHACIVYDEGSDTGTRVGPNVQKESAVISHASAAQLATIARESHRLFDRPEW